MITLGSRQDENGRTVVDCQSDHLTPFAVLVDVSGALQETSSTHLQALKAVSYIGLAISMACLLLTIIFFLVQWKKLLRSVHLLVHLNLAISLFCGYFVFATGVETASGSRGGCGFVAALLHYFFLASFCWMLCEGVMLYLMLVVVFSSFAKRWYLFLLLGWVPPLLPVLIGLAAGYDQYGVENDNGDLEFCWLSTRRGVIWAFVAPMIIIILINIVFLVLALRSIWKTRKSQKAYRNEKTSKRELAVSILKATVILLPLLGFTWLFGLLAVDENSLVFAWLFTLFNIFQGMAIFFFHVVRSEKVWTKISPQLTRLKNRTLQRRTYKFTSSSTLKSLSSSSTLKSSSSSTLKGVKYSARNDTFKMSTIKYPPPEEVKEDISVHDSQPEKVPLTTTEDNDKEREMRAKEKEQEALGQVVPESVVLENEASEVDV